MRPSLVGLAALFAADLSAPEVEPILRALGAHP